MIRGVALVLLIACGGPEPARPTAWVAPEGSVVDNTAPAQNGAPMPDVDEQDHHGWTPLMHAAQMGKLDEMKALLARGAAIEANTDTIYEGSTPLLIALQFSEEDAANLLLERGASIAGTIGDRALALAARNGSMALVERFLTAGVKASTWAVELAAKYGHGDIITRLVAAGAAVNVANADDHQFTPLMLACMENKPAAVEALLTAGARTDATDDDGETALHWAIFGARPVEIHEYQDLGQPHDTYWVPQRDAPVVELLVKAKANLGAINQDGDTPLHKAAQMDAQVAAEVLVAAGASRKTKNREGKTAYDIAKDRHNSVEAVLAPKRP